MNIINKILLIINVIIFAFACSEKAPDTFYQKLDFKSEAKLFIHNNEQPPPPPILAYHEIVLPVKYKDKEFDIIIENLVGKLVYDEYYNNQFSSYASFLEYLSTGKISIPSEFIDGFNYTMKIDTTFYGYIYPNNPLFKEYSENGFRYILDKYFVELGKYKKVFRYRLKSQDTTFSYNSIYKIMYENKYIGGTDDVSGETIFFRFINE